MRLDVQEFVDHAGQRFPIRLTLPGRAETDDELRSVAEIRIEGEAFAQLSTLYLEVRITADVRQPCRRCLAPVTSIVEIDEAFEIPVPAGVDAVDLWPEVLRLVLSAHDPNVLCKEDCRGLCPVCGADLNLEPEHSCTSDDDEPRRLGDLIRWTNES
jgi:uncharacterized protein